MDWLRAPQGEVRKPSITTWSDNHPLMQYVPVHDISIERAAKIDASNLTVIAASKDTPLIVASEKPRWVMLTFDLNSSDFALQTGFPVFIENVLAWFNREQLAVRRPPGEIEIPLANAEDPNERMGKWSHRTHSSAQLFSTQLSRGCTSPRRATPALPIAVNLTNPDLSNVNRSALKENPAAIPTIELASSRVLGLHGSRRADPHQCGVVHLSSQDHVVS